MTSQDTDAYLSDNNAQSTAASPPSIDDTVEAIANVTLQDEVVEEVDKKSTDSPPRPLYVYPRNELLNLHNSPLVGPPIGMPVFKDWFGDWNEQVGGKKESDSSATTTARDRRFRRDADDGDSARTSFRSGLSQPSQMGNFRHQPIRTTDKIGDKDLDRERERDLRDREGQERLRNLSDKYDRDRLALTSASNIRNKERDAAPHLSGTSTGRIGQTQTTGRRGEGRETTKRKAGESSDDWRRGAEPSRALKDDREWTDSRRDRDTRDRPRSRVRDSSRARRDPSTNRRDRDREDRDRPRDRRGDGDRDDRRDKDDGGRRDRDEFSRRDWDDGHDRDRERDDHVARDGRDRYDYSRRPRDRDDIDEDPRHWRDDGRRDERIASRREREPRERDRDRDWNRFEDRDRERPSGGDDRDARNRRGGRDRRPGGNDNAKEREDRRDRDKDREAEPAWMETYVPTTPGGGILGGKGADGELDGIQAWKKGMKDKERKEKGETLAESTTGADTNGVSDKPAPSETPMDEIQLFKLMMKREAEKKEGDKTQNGLSHHSLCDWCQSSCSNHSTEPTTQRAADHSKVSPVPDGEKMTPLDIAAAQSGPSTIIASFSSGAPDSSRPSQTSSPAIDRPIEVSRVVGPRLSQISAGISPSSSLGSANLVDHSLTSPSANTFNPPPGSRMLALKARVPSSASANGVPGAGHVPPPGMSASNPQGLPPGVSNLPPHLPEAAHEMQYGGQRMDQASRGIRSFSPLHNGTGPHGPLEDMRENIHLGQIEGLRRTSGSAAERAILGLPGDPGPSYADLGGPQQGGFPPGVMLDPAALAGNANFAKGSRFAKFFDSKTRDVPAGGPRMGQQTPNMASPISHLNQRQESISLGGMGGLRGERTMEDIFAMLQSSAQASSHRGSPQIPQSGRMHPGGGQFPQSQLELQILHQQQQQQQQQQQLQHLNHTRLESLYDTRLDDRNFVPDGLVPGLRPVPPRSRSREPGGVLFNEQIDDPLHFNVQRLTQQRNMEQQMYNQQMPSMYNQQQANIVRNGGGGGLQMQQSNQFRGASPGGLSAQNALQGGGPPTQRLPPGLANLGGRPPHDPSQYLGAGAGGGMGMGVGGIGGGMHGATPAQQVYNTFHQGGLGFTGVGNQPLRGPPGGGPGPQIGMGGLGPNVNVNLNNINELRALGVGGGGSGGMRDGPGFGPQHGHGGQLAALRQQQVQQQAQQQQQQHIPAHMMQHMLPGHLQQGMPGGNAQTTQDLMALLMGGHRE
ncbi:uncharacterized protein BXZ73DRAFT_39881 [Epithele typhae]|uniref:uncharacterized protein n=1 Tax=Epithele typhae TaxID=378194 RepID=UPI00200805DC|nr:uncharacterized protein BXZ73DRAFT_39881 [Epithele typhae]KAH9944463.1 hypothetical protein BXZ73DRAFT_39881 [Epithele typhae]